MTTLHAFLLSTLGLYAKRILGALGFVVVSYAALVPLLNSAMSHVTDNLGALPATAFALANYAGLSECFAILFSALLTRVALMAQKQLMLG